MEGQLFLIYTYVIICGLFLKKLKPYVLCLSFQFETVLVGITLKPFQIQTIGKCFLIFRCIYIPVDLNMIIRKSEYITNPYSQFLL